jgi:hypothetical protein
MSKDRGCCGDCYECTLTIEEQNELTDCDCIDGRYIGAVSEYASSCDGCGELTTRTALRLALRMCSLL